MSNHKLNMIDTEDGFRWLFGDRVMPRHRADWMTGSDDVILEFLEDTGAGHNLQGISNNFEDCGIEISYTTLTRRIPILKEAALVRVLPGKGKYYAITEKGRAYLEGETDLRDTDEPGES